MTATTPTRYRRHIRALWLTALFAGAAACAGDDNGATENEGGATPTNETTAADTSTNNGDNGENETTTTELDQWAADFCGPFTGWIESIDTAAAAAQTADPAGLDEGQQFIIDLFATATEETDALIDAVEEVGPPPLDDGDALLEDLLGIFDDFNSAAGTARWAAEGIDTDDPEAFEQDIDTAHGAFQDEIAGVSEAFSQLDRDYPSPELAQALTAAC